MKQRVSRRQLDQSIHKLSRIMARLLAAVVLLYPVVLAAYAFGAGPLVLSHPWVVAQGIQASDLTPHFSIVLFAVLLFASAPLIWGLWRLQRMFGDFADGKVFAVSAVAEFERFTWALAIIAITMPLASVLFGILLHLCSLSSQPSLVVSVSSNDVLVLLLSLILGVIAKVMRMAAHIAAENAEYV